MSIITTFENFKDLVNENTTSIMIGAGVASFIAGSYFVGKGVLKADKILKEKQEENPEEDIPTSETVKTYVICLFPAIILIVGGTVLVITANAMDIKDKAALGAVAVAGNDKLKEYKKKVEEKLGVKKADEIRKDIAADKVRTIDTDTADIIMTGKGNTLFCDCQSGRLFRSSIESIRRGVNDANEELLRRAKVMNRTLDVDTNVWLNLNDIYGFFGLPEIDAGKFLGVNLQDDGLFKITEPFEVVETANGVRCILLEYEVNPIQDYHMWY